MSDQPSLFVVMLGGRHAKANTEVHDVVFAIGTTLQEVYPQLKQAWFGEQEGLHIDAWSKIDTVSCGAQHYHVQFKAVAADTSAAKLYLINLGGYDPQEFGELHRYVLLVAQDAVEAKAKGKQYIATDWHKPHTDRVVDVDDCLLIQAVNGHYLHLLAYDPAVCSIADTVENQWENTYIRI